MSMDSIALETSLTTPAAAVRRDRRPARATPVTFRVPDLDDGAEMWRLARTSEALETNTPYSYLMLADLMAESCVVAERGDEIVGFVSGLIPAQRPDTLFVWQIGVDRRARARGLGRRMIAEILGRECCADVRYLEATVTPSNKASAALFRSVARHFGAPCIVTSGYPRSAFPGSGHEEERLFRIGPFDTSQKPGSTQ